MPLSYADPETSVARGGGSYAISVVAVVLALFGCPCLRLTVHTRPFWTGHALERIGEVADHVPPDVLPILAFVLGLCGYLASADRRRRGKALAQTALALSVMWESSIILARVLGPFFCAMPNPN